MGQSGIRYGGVGQAGFPLSLFSMAQEAELPYLVNYSRIDLSERSSMRATVRIDLVTHSSRAGRPCLPRPGTLYMIDNRQEKVLVTLQKLIDQGLKDRDHCGQRSQN